MNKKIATSLIFVITTVSALGQIDTPHIPPERDLRDLYARIAASQLVVVGTVVNESIASKRVPPNDIQAARASLDDPVDGWLYTIRVEKTLCGDSNFDDPTAQSYQKSLVRNQKMVYIFVPQDEPLFRGGYRKEDLIRGHRYLLFLVSPPPERQKKWVDSLELDPARTYYRGEELSRGVIPLALDNLKPEQTPVLDKVTRLCQALQDPLDKISALKRLINSGDPILQSQAEAALEALQAKPK